MGGEPWQSKEYCTKEDTTAWEYGECPPSKEQCGKIGGEMERKRYADAYDAAREGRWDDIDKDIQFRHYEKIKKMKIDFAPDAPNLPPQTGCEAIWLVGSTGTGKSRTARAHANKFNKPPYFKMLNKWWDNFQPGVHDQVIIEEVDNNCEWMASFLKIWTDSYAFPVEAKGTVTKNIRPSTIIVTSNYFIQQVFKEPAQYEPLLRRFKVWYFAKNEHDKPSFPCDKTVTMENLFGPNGDYYNCDNPLPSHEEVEESYNNSPEPLANNEATNIIQPPPSPTNHNYDAPAMLCEHCFVEGDECICGKHFCMLHYFEHQCVQQNNDPLIDL